MKTVIRIKRVYESPEKSDGYRILADRLWPRGVSREVAAVHEWIKELAPSTELRTWFGHDPALWPEFQHKYLSELKKNPAVHAFVEAHRDKKVITLAYAAKDEIHNQAIVLQKYLQQLFETSE